MSENAVPEEFPAGTLDFKNVKVINFTGGGIQTINGDNTAAQVLSNVDLSIVITDLGGGTHTFRVRAIFQVQSTGVVAVTIPDNVETTLLTDIVSAIPGLYYVFATIQAASVLPGSCMVRARIYNGAAVIGEDIREVTISGAVNGYAASVFSYLVFYAGGETITCKVLANTGGGTFDVFATMNIFRIGL